MTQAATPLRTGHDALRAAARLAMREGERAYAAGAPVEASPYDHGRHPPLVRAAWREGWRRARGTEVLAHQYA